MANTKRSSTKAKPKTRAAKTTKPKAVQTTKAPAKAAAKAVKPVSLPVDSSGLRKILSISAALYIALAVVAGAYMTSVTYQLTAGYLTSDALSSKTSAVFAPATRVMYDIELRWVVVTLLVLAAILPMLYLTSLQRSYSERLKGRVLAWRWVDFAVTGALMVEITALLSGVQDLGTLKLAGGIVALAAVFGWVAEQQNENAVKPLWGAYIAGLASLALVILVIGWYAVGTYVYGAVRSPWYVYALYGVLVVSFVLYAINQANQHRRFRNWKDYLIVERNHLLISFASKVAFAAILITGLTR